MPTDTPKTFTADEVKELIKQTTEQTTKTIFAEFGPILQSIALTPEKLREANKPYIAPEELARKNHERKEFAKAEEQRNEGIRRSRLSCKHKDDNGKYVIGISHNFHDGLPRGVCPRCGITIEPAHWDWRPKLKKDGEIVNEAFVTPPDPLYYVVQNLEAYGKKYTGV